MSKSREPESSLELLLDTMCNTFGGVMFIAIALMVVLSAVSKVEESIMVDGDLQKLTQRLDDLKKEVETVRQSNIIRDESIKIIQNDPRRQMIAQITALEKESKDLEVQNKLIAAENKVLNEKNRRMISRLTKLQNELNALELELTRNETENIAMKNKIARIREEMTKIVSGHISFRSKRYTTKSPYFFIVSKQRLWRVGPEADHKMASDVVVTRRGEQFICTVNPDASGIPILINGSLSPAAIKALGDIPNDRAPKFALDSDSIAEFCVLREYMKKEDIPHGISVEFAEIKALILVYTSKQKENEVF